jgi:AcrR family transcriptional regulator
LAVSNVTAQAQLARSGERSPATDRGERTRQRLLDAARVVFERRGYHGAAVADIAKAAGTAHGTFYKYFESKDDIFRALTNQVVGAMFERTRRRRPAPDAVHRIVSANWRYIQAFREDADFLAIVWQVVMFEPEYREFWLLVRQRWADTIERWVTREVEAGTADVRLDPAVAARALGLMMESVLQTWFVLGVDHDEHTALSTLSQLWINALQLDVGDADVSEVAARVLAAG